MPHLLRSASPIPVGAAERNKRKIWPSVKTHRTPDLLSSRENHRCSLKNYKAADSLIEITKAWQHATLEEQQELVKIIFLEIRYDFDQNRLVTLRPKPEYDILFEFLDSVIKGEGGLYYLR